MSDLKKPSRGDYQGVIPEYRSWKIEREAATEKKVDALMKTWNSELSGEALFVAQCMIVCGLPVNRTEASQVVRRARLTDGRYLRLTFVRTSKDIPLPFRQDRSMVFFLQHKAVISGSPWLKWDHVNEYQHLFGLDPDGGGSSSVRVQERFARVAYMDILVEYIDKAGKTLIPHMKIPLVEGAQVSGIVDGEGNWKLNGKPSQVLKNSQGLRIGQLFFDQWLSKDRAVPIPIELLRLTYTQPRVQDYAVWIYWRTFAAKEESFVPYDLLRSQFDDTDSNYRRWRSEFLKAKTLLAMLPMPFMAIHVEVEREGVRIFPLPPGVTFFTNHPKRLI